MARSRACGRTDKSVAVHAAHAANCVAPLAVSGHLMRMRLLDVCARDAHGELAVIDRYVHRPRAVYERVLAPSQPATCADCTPRKLRRAEQMLGVGFGAPTTRATAVDLSRALLRQSKARVQALTLAAGSVRA